ncbi:MAG: hypothetical protein JWL77_1734 [Chthonomonadaceae bacterium]|nr:hypothetical protein [Chthonomonadaceae bacterium]
MIVALVKQDTNLALGLINVGANPNAPYHSLPKPSLANLCTYLFDPAPLPERNIPTAFLMACGASMFNNDGGANNLFATFPDDPRLVQTMLQHGATLNEKDFMDWTPLFWAIRKHNPKTIRVLLEKGADVNAKDMVGQTPLMAACDGDTPLDTIRLLLEHGADPNLSDNGGMTALQSAQHNKRRGLEALLRQAGAKK